METDRVWFYLAMAWTLVGVISIVFSWVSRIELGIYWFGCIIVGQLCFVHRKLFQIHRAIK